MFVHNNEALQQGDIHLCEGQPNQACLQNLQEDKSHLDLVNPTRTQSEFPK